MTATPEPGAAPADPGGSADDGGLPIAYLPEFRRGLAHTPRREKASEATARRIVADLRDGGYAVGDRLPLEGEMVVAYGVSRDTLREALRLLEVQGVVRVKRGPLGGPVVSSVNAAFLARSASLLFHLSGSTYEELFEAWLALEPQLAARAATNPDRATVRAQLDSYLDEGHTADVAGEEFFQRATDFHGVLSRLSGNRVLTLICQAVEHLMTDQVVADYDPMTASSTITDDHTALARAIAAGDADEAHRLSEEHIQHMLEHYRTMTPHRLGDVIEWR